MHLAAVTEPLTRIDIEAAFLLSVPLVDLDVTRSGSCLLAVTTVTAKDAKPEDRLTGVHVEINGGDVASCVSRLEQEPRTWALGTVESWVDAILEGNVGGLRIGGAEAQLAEAVVGGIHASLL
jgi:hypothetical protein